MKEKSEEAKKRRKRKRKPSRQMIRNFIAKQTRRNEYRRRNGKRKMAQRSV